MPNEDYKPLQVTYVAEVPTGEEDVKLINILTRQIQNGPEWRDNVLRACKFILDKYSEESTHGN